MDFMEFVERVFEPVPTRAWGAAEKPATAVPHVEKCATPNPVGDIPIEMVVAAPYLGRDAPLRAAYRIANPGRSLPRGVIVTPPGPRKDLPLRTAGTKRDSGRDPPPPVAIAEFFGPFIVPTVVTDARDVPLRGVLTVDDCVAPDPGNGTASKLRGECHRKVAWSKRGYLLATALRGATPSATCLQGGCIGSSQRHRIEPAAEHIPPPPPRQRLV